MHSDYRSLQATPWQQLSCPDAGGRIDDAGGPPSAYLWRSFLDLSPFDQGPSDASSIECAYRQFANEALPRMMIQTHPVTGLRELLAWEIGLPGYGIRRAAELPVSLRTDRWHVMAEQVAEAERPHQWPAARLVRLATLLNTLGLYRDTALLLGGAADADSADGDVATLSIRHAMAVHRCEHSARSAAFNVEVLSRAVTNPRGDPHVRIGAGITLIVLFAKGGRKDIGLVRHWREVTGQLCRFLRPSTDFGDALYVSAYWRAASFLPYLTGDRESTLFEMALAEEHASAIAPASDVERMLWSQAVHPLLESRAREAHDAGDLDSARRLIARLVKMDPLSSKAWLYAGYLTLAAGDTREALSEFSVAARLGSPCTAVAWLMIGKCQEAQGDGQAALAAYAEAVRADPANVDGRRAITELADQGAPDADLLGWWAGWSLREIARAGGSATIASAHVKESP